MKKIIFTLLSFSLLYFNSNAQYCGNSGPTVCTPTGQMTEPGLSPVSDSLAPVVNGTVANTIIQFKNYDTITFAGQLLTFQSLKIDSIENLPAGLCWETNKTNNTYGNQEDGCIKVSGTTCAAPGQYRLRIIITANVGFTLNKISAAAAGLYYYVRVKNAGDSDTPVDTTGQSTNSTPAFQPYGQAAVCGVGISDLNSSISTLSITPNPFNSKAEVSFFSDKSGVMTERITNMIGSEVYNKEIEVKTGDNKSVIERDNLPVGVYFYSIGNGKNLVTKRLVISE
ncbi:MAG: T9SS type A sorting domain-containing protein [Bacteroidota bacterium]